MTISELMVILEAAKRGERTQMFMDEQWKDFNVEEWVNLFAPFRVDPEPRKPREWNIIISKDGYVKWGFPYDDMFHGDDTAVHVIEVLHNE